LAEPETIRVELAFDGGQIIAALVSPEAADALDRALAASSQGTLELETIDGVLFVVLPRLVYAKRYARDAQVGFGG
jgi:hypothetical protein